MRKRRGRWKVSDRCRRRYWVAFNLQWSSLTTGGLRKKRLPLHLAHQVLSFCLWAASALALAVALGLTSSQIPPTWITSTPSHPLAYFPNLSEMNKSQARELTVSSLKILDGPNIAWGKSRSRIQVFLRCTTSEFQVGILNLSRDAFWMLTGRFGRVKFNRSGQQISVAAGHRQSCSKLESRNNMGI